MEINTLPHIETFNPTAHMPTPGNTAGEAEVPAGVLSRLVVAAQSTGFRILIPPMLQLIGDVGHGHGYPPCLIYNPGDFP